MDIYYSTVPGHTGKCAVYIHNANPEDFKKHGVSTAYFKPVKKFLFWHYKTGPAFFGHYGCDFETVWFADEALFHPLKELTESGLPGWVQFLVLLIIWILIFIYG